MNFCTCNSADAKHGTYEQEGFYWKMCFTCGYWASDIVKHNNMGLAPSHYKPSKDGH